MKIIIFDVSNAACALVVCPNGNSLMIDCGSNREKDCPIDTINDMRSKSGWLSNMKNYATQRGAIYPLTTLAITHPDLDHINNAKKIKEEFEPYLLLRRYLEEFPKNVVDKNSPGLINYKSHLCDKYRGDNPETPNWGFTRKTLFSFSV